MSTLRTLTIVASLFATGCAVQPVATEPSSEPNFSFASNSKFQAIGSANTKYEKDRAAVLAMQGEYEVGFHFEETVILKDGYERKDPKDSGAYETVIVIRNDPKHIILQHILVSQDGEHVIKHWRQDWTYESPERFEFVADQTWAVKQLDPAKTTGAWTQCVFEVSDAPRYCGTGKVEP